MMVARSTRSASPRAWRGVPREEVVGGIVGGWRGCNLRRRNQMGIRELLGRVEIATMSQAASAGARPRAPVT
eukprot:8314008-Pyramimonas_sp.AAC.1